MANLPRCCSPSVQCDKVGIAALLDWVLLEAMALGAAKFLEADLFVKPASHEPAAIPGLFGDRSARALF